MRADPIPGTGEARRCANPACGAPLVRQVRRDGSLEYRGRFQDRRYCSRACYFRARHNPARTARTTRRLLARLEREQARQEGEASRLLTRPPQIAGLEAALRATELWRDLPAPQYDTLRLLAALCGKYRGLAAAREFLASVAWTVRAAAAS